MRFYPVRVDVSAHPLFISMTYRPMFVTCLIEILICLEFIGHDLGTFGDSLIDNPAKNLFPRGTNCPCFKLALSLQGSHNRLLLPGTALSAFFILPAHIGFVHFHDAAELWTRNLCHSFSDTVAQIPRSFIADIQASFELISRNTLLGFCHEVNGKEPLPEGQMGIVEDRASRYGELVAASIAIKLAALLYAAYLLRSAPRAFYSSHPFKGFKILTAFVVVAAVFLDEVYQINVHRNLP